MPRTSRITVDGRLCAAGKFRTPWLHSGLFFPAEPGRRGQLHDRWQSRDQRRRHAGRALRQYARDLCLGLEVVTAQGDIWQWTERPAQGQHGLRPARPVHRQRRHAGRDHCSDDEALSRSLRQRRPPWPPAATLARLRWRCCRWRTCPAGCRVDRLRGHEPVFARTRGTALLCPAPATAGRRVDRAAGTVATPRARRRRVLRFESLLEAALEAGVDQRRRGGGKSMAQSQAMWHVRESIPLAQAEEGLNIKHDIALPVSAIPSRTASAPMPPWRQRFPGVRLVNFGHLGDGNLHYNVQAPGGNGPGRLPSRAGARRQRRSSTTRVQACGGSISAEHGVGQLKRDGTHASQERRWRSAMMRCDQGARSIPQGLMNPGRVV